MFWLSIETKSAEVLSYAVLATLLPQALLGPIAGVYVCLLYTSCLRAVDAHEPVRFAPRFGGKIEVVVFAARFKVAHPAARAR